MGTRTETYDGRSDTRQTEPTPVGEPETPPVLPEPVWRGVFSEYRQAVAKATDACDAFHFSALLTRAGAELGRRVWFPYGMRIYPNFYCLNFGPTGDHKTTAQRFSPQLGSRIIKTISGAGSGEGLADEFQGLPAGTPVLVVMEEFSELLRRGRWEGSTVLQFLTTCFDCPPHYQLKYRKNPVDIEEPTPSLMGGTTPEWFWQSARLDDFKGGFANRILYFTGKRKPFLPLPAEPDLSGIQARVDALADVPNGQVKLSESASRLWQKFSLAWDAKQQVRDPMLRIAVERVPAYVLKICTVFAGFEHTLPEIEKDQLAAGILAGNFCAECAGELLSLQNAGTNPTKELERRILAFIAAQPNSQTTKRQVYRSLWRHYTDATQFDRSFMALVRAGELYAESKCRGMVEVSIP